MLHPDGQYDPELIGDLVRPILDDRADMVLGSRSWFPAVCAAGMPAWKIVGNRLLTGFENLAMGTRFSECHTGYRAYSAGFLRQIPVLRNSNVFVFDSQVIAQAVAFEQRVVEVPARTRYFSEASSVGFAGSVRYGLKTVGTMLLFLAWRLGLVRSRLFQMTAPRVRRLRARHTGSSCRRARWTPGAPLHDRALHGCGVGRRSGRRRTPRGARSEADYGGGTATSS
jgi:hypothetical protein